MSNSFFFAGLMIGAVSGFHCIGMCGPIALSLPIYNLPSLQKIMAIVLYNLGRMITYVLLGILFSFIGKQIFIAGYQQILSIAIGLLIIVASMSYFLKTKMLKINIIGSFQKKLFAWSIPLFSSTAITAKLFIGMINGLLPCGMVYFALLTALSTGGILNGISLMIGFGFGTSPLLLLIMQLGIFLSINLRKQIRTAIPYFMGIVGVLLVLRGMNLGIPFISPHFENIASNTISCH